MAPESTSRWLVLLAASLLATTAVSCATAPAVSLDEAAPGVEVQVYPAGVIPAAHVQLPVSDEDVVTARLGWNFTDRGDFGEHDDEHGGGPGGGLGYRHYFGPQRSGWLLGGRVDLWFLDIDWRDDASGGNPRRTGNTDVVVLQPTIEGGYRFRLGRSTWLDLALGLGYEINVHDDGEDVGEGGITLLGATLVFGP